MAWATHDGIRIRYETLGSGAPLVLVHGATVGLEMWEELGYTSALAGDHRLILIDARGHGQSDKPHDPAQYGPDCLAGDVLAVLDALEFGEVDYLGASLGAAIGFELARSAAARIRSLTLLGYGRYGPLTEAQQQFHTAGLRLFGLGAQIGGGAILAALAGRGAAISPVMRAAYETNDWQALLALQTEFVTWRALDDALPQIMAPSLLIAAEGDPFYASAQQCAQAMANARFVALPAGVHGQDSYPASLVVPHLRALSDGIRAEVG